MKYWGSLIICLGHTNDSLKSDTAFVFPIYSHHEEGPWNAGKLSVASARLIIKQPYCCLEF